MQNENPIVVLLASYNGGKYIDAQIQSLLNQSYSNWKLIIRDDQSSDNTLSIIKKYVENFPEKISLLEDKNGNVGSVQNFNLLLHHVQDASYIMYCDQDDVWLKDKIADTYKAMIKAEKDTGENYPLLVYTNFKYSDENLKEIESKKDFQSTKISDLQFSHLLAQNPAYGCTMMMNNALKNIIKNIPPEAENHDYWTALTASAFGKIIYLEQKTILYRQHAKNVSGNFDNDLTSKRMLRIIKGKAMQDVQSKIKMAVAFKNIFEKKLSGGQLKTLDDFIKIKDHKNLKLLFKNFKNGVKKQTASQTFLFYTTLLFYTTPKDIKESYP